MTKINILKEKIKNKIQAMKSSIETFKEKTYKNVARKILENEFIEIEKRHKFAIESLQEEYAKAAYSFLNNPEVIIEKTRDWNNPQMFIITAYFQAHEDFGKFPIFSKIHIDEMSLYCNKESILDLEQGLLHSLLQEFKKHIKIIEKTAL